MLSLIIHHFPICQSDSGVDASNQSFVETMHAFVIACSVGVVHRSSSAVMMMMMMLEPMTPILIAFATDVVSMLSLMLKLMVMLMAALMTLMK